MWLPSFLGAGDSFDLDRLGGSNNRRGREKYTDENEGIKALPYRFIHDVR